MLVFNKYRDILSKIINSLLCNCLGSFQYLILFLLHRDIGPATYVTLLEQNSMFHKQRSIINLYSFEESTFQEQLVFPSFDDSDNTKQWYGIATKYLCIRKQVISMEPTCDTEDKGCYILIVPIVQKE